MLVVSLVAFFLLVPPSIDPYLLYGSRENPLEFNGFKCLNPHIEGFKRSLLRHQNHHFLVFVFKLPTVPWGSFSAPLFTALPEGLAPRDGAK